MNASTKTQLHTAWCDYFGTGEGRTLLALVTYARDEAHMRQLVRERLGEFWSVFAQVEAGVARNEVTQRLWPAAVLEFLEGSASDQAGVISAKSELHVNFS